MNLLKLHKQSLDRIYGNNLDSLRESHQALMLALDGVYDLLNGDVDEMTSLYVLSGTMYRHFMQEKKVMEKKGYAFKDKHEEKHHEFIELVEDFIFNFNYSSRQKNRILYNALQKWLSAHLIIDDDHFHKQLNLA